MLLYCRLQIPGMLISEDRNPIPELHPGAVQCHFFPALSDIFRPLAAAIAIGAQPLRKAFLKLPQEDQRTLMAFLDLRQVRQDL